MQDNETESIFRSIPLEPKELTALKRFIKKYPNRSLAAKALGLGNRTTLANVLRAGSGRSDTIALIRSVIGTAA